jgi:hypothetical protein
MSELQFLATWLGLLLNFLVVPTLVFVVRIEKRLTTLEVGSVERRRITDRRCPIDTGSCPINNRRFTDGKEETKVSR